MNLTQNALQVLNKRYLKKDSDGNVIESPEDMFRRVADTIAHDNSELADIFYGMMISLDFLPNSPTLMNAGREMGMLSACFVIPIEDSMESIFEAVKNAALIHKSGGGTGFSFSKLRPRNSVVGSTQGVSSGPVSFMNVFNAATQAVKQGSLRRGANMGILRIDHPDIREFINCKRDTNKLNNFNISVGITDKFMTALSIGENYQLINPHNNEIICEESAIEIFDLLVYNAHATGEPGVLFLDRLGDGIEATNPCGESGLLPYESCNLGSINLSNFYNKLNNNIDFYQLKLTVRLAVQFLDRVIDVNNYPLDIIREATLKTRKIGLGVMGFSDLLIKLGVDYDSDASEEYAHEIMKFINDVGHKESNGRNNIVTTIAPTGTLSIIAGCSSGIEPIFATHYTRTIMDGTEMTEVHPLYTEDNKHLFRTSHKVSPEWHVRIQAAFQAHTDNAVSKTINFPHDATVLDINNAYLLAYKSGCKGITVYRDGSRDGQVLDIKDTAKIKTKHEKLVPRERPDITTGTTEKIQTGCGKLYVTVNSDIGGFCEVFCTMGRSGGCTASQSEALSRLISLALRSGVSIVDITHQLKGIRCPSPIWTNGELVLSCADAVGRALHRYINGNGNNHNTNDSNVDADADLDSDLNSNIVENAEVYDNSSDIISSNIGRCPECDDKLEHVEGCQVCITCGYSKCGG